jgi:hypothetical protein
VLVKPRLQRHTTPDAGSDRAETDTCTRKGDIAMAVCDLGDIGAAIGEGRNDRDVGNAPGELSLAALVRAARLDPEQSIREYRAEALSASQDRAGADVFSGRRLLARSQRYARAAALVEVLCVACADSCVADPSALGPGIRERRIARERRLAGWRAGSRRLDDRVGRRLPQFA